MSNGGSGGGRVAATVVFVVVVAAAIIVPFAHKGDSLYPRAWDPRVAPIADKVAALRGLTFEHPVPVRFLAPAAFEKEVAGDPADNSASSSPEVKRTEATLRALGLIGAKVNLAKAVTDTARSGTLALYSFRRKEILVRGTTLDASHRVTLAHELTHVLQDQHFNLTKLEKQASDSTTGDSDAFRALVEGDAVRIEDEYRKSLSKADQRAYDAEQEAESKRFDSETKGVPDVVPFLFGAPYAFGPATIQVLDESGGSSAVNDAISGPTPGSRLFIQPGVVVPDDYAKDPEVPSGGKQVGETDLFDAFPTLVTLGMKLDAARALKAADGVTGGHAITFERGKTVCYRVALVARSGSADQFIRAALTDWAKQQPSATVDPTKLGFTACDPGSRARTPSQTRFEQLSSLLGNRSAFTVELAKQPGITAPMARCIARELMQQPGIAALLDAVGNNEPNEQQLAQVRGAALAGRIACEATAEAGLP